MKKLFFLFAIILISLTSKADTSLYGINEMIINQINIYRAEHNLPGLKYDARADSSSKHHCKYITELGVVTHYEEDSIGNMPVLSEIDDRFAKYGLTNYWVMGENVAGVFDTLELSREVLVSKVMQGWKDSPSHNAMLLNPHITMIGVNTFKGDHETYYYEDEVTGDIIMDTIAIKSWMFVMNVFTEKV